MAELPVEQNGARVYPKDLNPQIHGLRGFASLLVFVYHVYGVGLVWGFWPASLNPIAGLFEAARHGVEIFFIISGYLITGSLLRHANAGRFLVDRCIRIYPVFLTIHILVFAIGPAIGYRWMAGISLSDWATTFVENALFLPGLFYLPLAQSNAWSLSYEAGFYLLSATAFVVATRLGKTFAIVTVGAAVSLILMHRPEGCTFMAGTAVFFLNAWRPIKVPGIVRHLSVITFAATPILLSIDEHSFQTNLLACLPGFLFFWSIVEGRCALSAFLRSRPLQYLGTISYSFYLWSPFITYPMKVAIERYLVGRVNPLLILLLFAVLGLAASLIVSQLSYQFLEIPAGRWLKGRIKSRRALPSIA